MKNKLKHTQKVSFDNALATRAINKYQPFYDGLFEFAEENGLLNKDVKKKISKLAMEIQSEIISVEQAHSEILKLNQVKGQGSEETEGPKAKTNNGTSFKH